MHYCVTNDNKKIKVADSPSNTGTCKEVENIQEDLNQIKLHVPFSF